MTIQQLLSLVIERSASDLHLVVDSPPVLRVDGLLVPVAGEEKLTNSTVERLITSVLSEDQKQVYLANKEIDFSFQLAGSARFRVNAYFQKGFMAASFRMIPMKIAEPDDLGLPKIVHDFAKLKQGFVLVTGPTGHGKSTTLAAILDEINHTRPVHVVTVEDPIEYVYTCDKAIVSQREVHNDTHSWEIALRSVLREDPDVVLVGEMRDFETIASALTIAETGHLVFATLHTNSAAQTVDRIVDVFPGKQQPQVRLQLSGNIEAVFSQRLVPKIKGGRTAAYEVMVAIPAIRTAIREARTHMLDNIIMTSGEFGMITLEASLVRLVHAGVISEDVARAYAVRPADVVRYMKGERK